MAPRVVTRSSWTFRGLTFELAGTDGGTRGPGWRKCTGYRLPGPRGPPLGLSLSEGLGLGARW